MKKTTLVIMAAGLGSRFGQGIKQLERIGPSGEIIMDYSIHDALAAGFNKIVFILRREIERDFREIIGERVQQLCEVEYVFQSVEQLPIAVPSGRTKPWGTGQAVLCCREVVHEPFAIINADDYYGKSAFKKIHDFLVDNYDKPQRFCMAGFVLCNTLSENGGVTRGLCEVSERGELIGVRETKNIIKTPQGAAVSDERGIVPLDAQGFVSMNMWGATPLLFDALHCGFCSFLTDAASDLQRGEFLLPLAIDKMIKAGEITVSVLPSHDRWFGITFMQDKPFVVDAFNRLVAEGEYTTPLWQRD